MSLIAELKRRNVFKVGAAYLAFGWVVLQRVCMFSVKSLITKPSATKS